MSGYFFILFEEMPSVATQLRKNIQTSAKEGNVQELRVAIDSLYGEDSPFNNTEHHMQTSTLAPIIEASILSKASGQTEVFDELLLDLKHFHAAFGMSEEDHDDIASFMNTLEGDKDEMIESAMEYFEDTDFPKLKFVN